MGNDKMKFVRAASCASRASFAASGGIGKAFKADCAKVAEIERMVGEVISHFGAVHILVNNAGVFQTVPVEETTEAIWDDSPTSISGAPSFA